MLLGQPSRSRRFSVPETRINGGFGWQARFWVSGCRMRMGKSPDSTNSDDPEGSSRSTTLHMISKLVLVSALAAGAMTTAGLAQAASPAPAAPAPAPAAPAAAAPRSEE